MGYPLEKIKVHLQIREGKSQFFPLRRWPLPGLARTHYLAQLKLGFGFLGQKPMNKG
jgi:hypothetical protein